MATKVKLKVSTNRTLRHPFSGEQYIRASDIQAWMHDQAEKAVKNNQLQAANAFMYVFDEVDKARDA